VGDEQDRGIQLLPQIPEQLQDLGLHGDVQGGGRFVRDQHGRIVGQGQRDHRALFLTAGQLMREGVDPGGRLRNAHQVEQFDGPPPRLGSADPLVDAERFGDLPADGAAGVERSSAVCPSRSVGAIAHRRTWSVATDAKHGAADPQPYGGPTRVTTLTKRKEDPGFRELRRIRPLMSTRHPP